MRSLIMQMPAAPLILFVILAQSTLFLGVVSAAPQPQPSDFLVNDHSGSYFSQPVTVEQGTTGMVTVKVSSQGHFAGTIIGSLDSTVKCQSPKPPVLCAANDPGSVTLKTGEYATFTIVIPTTPSTPITSLIPTTVRFNMTNTNAASGVVNQKVMDLMVTIVAPTTPDYGIYTSGGIPTIKVSPSGSGSSTLMVTSFNGFSGAVGLSGSIATPGLTTIITPNQLTLSPGQTQTATVNVTSVSTQPFGTSLLIVNANGSPGNHATVFSVRVNPYYNMTVDPSPITVVLGTSVSATLTVNTNGFTNRLAFNITGTPYGLSAKLRDPVFPVSKNTKLNSTTIELSAFQSMTPGSYNIILNGMIVNATGTDKSFSSKTLTIPVIVNTSPTTGKPNNNDNRTVTPPSSNSNNLLIIAGVAIAAIVGVLTAVIRRQGFNVKRFRRSGTKRTTPPTQPPKSAPPPSGPKP